MNGPASDGQGEEDVMLLMRTACDSVARCVKAEEEARRQCKELEGRLAGSEAKQAEAERAAAAAKDQTRQQDIKIRDLNKEVGKGRESAKEWEEKVRGLESALQATKGERDAFEREKGSLKFERDALRDAARAHGAQVEELEHKLTLSEEGKRAEALKFSEFKCELRARYQELAAQVSAIKSKLGHGQKLMSRTEVGIVLSDLTKADTDIQGAALAIDPPRSVAVHELVPATPDRDMGSPVLHPVSAGRVSALRRDVDDASRMSGARTAGKPRHAVAFEAGAGEHDDERGEDRGLASAANAAESFVPSSIVPESVVPASFNFEGAAPSRVPESLVPASFNFEGIAMTRDGLEASSFNFEGIAAREASGRVVAADGGVAGDEISAEHGDAQGEEEEEEGLPALAEATSAGLSLQGKNDHVVAQEEEEEGEEDPEVTQMPPERARVQAELAKRAAYEAVESEDDLRVSQLQREVRGRSGRDKASVSPHNPNVLNSRRSRLSLSKNPSKQDSNAPRIPLPDSPPPRHTEADAEAYEQQEQEEIPESPSISQSMLSQQSPLLVSAAPPPPKALPQQPRIKEEEIDDLGAPSISPLQGQVQKEASPVSRVPGPGGKAPEAKELRYDDEDDQSFKDRAPRQEGDRQEERPRPDQAQRSVRQRMERREEDLFEEGQEVEEERHPQPRQRSADREPARDGGWRSDDHGRERSAHDAHRAQQPPQRGREQGMQHGRERKRGPAPPAQRPMSRAATVAASAPAVPAQHHVMRRAAKEHPSVKDWIGAAQTLVGREHEDEDEDEDEDEEGARPHKKRSRAAGETEGRHKSPDRRAEEENGGQQRRVHSSSHMDAGAGDRRRGGSARWEEDGAKRMRDRRSEEEEAENGDGLARRHTPQSRAAPGWGDGGSGDKRRAALTESERGSAPKRKRSGTVVGKIEHDDGRGMKDLSIFKSRDASDRYDKHALLNDAKSHHQKADKEGELLRIMEERASKSASVSHSRQNSTAAGGGFSRNGSVRGKVEAAPKANYVVRNKEERASMKATNCPACQGFLETAFKGRNVDPDAICKCTSRHRHHHTPPQTPEGFWHPGLTSQEMDMAAAKHMVPDDGGLAENVRNQMERKKSRAMLVGEL